MRAPGKTFHVSADLAQQTLMAVLRAFAPSLTWSQARKMIEGKRVLVNGNLCLDAARRLKPTEVVKFLDRPAADPPRDEDVKIVYFDDDIVVVEKPAGMNSIRHIEERNWPSRRRQLQPSLDELVPVVLARITKTKRSRKGNLPPVRPVHRIDRETSGLMLFARTVQAESHLGKQFRKHSLKRSYLALAYGAVAEQTIRSRLVDDRGDGKRGSTPIESQGKEAVTHVSVAERLGDFSLLRLRLETGRTHQIRIHLSELGHRLCGERVYTHALGEPPMADSAGAPRVCLHAAELGFVHPTTGELLEFSSPLPEDFAAFLDRLRAKAQSSDGERKVT